eukprot:TRINITY_DN57916_c0_g1_i1.p1 TRINITY_DN57916_c0_g1~~TRINITY_DN57916_c0_g1_i1.p1  ORF type:complete len:383 (-),score=53.49 TRINITY_DN57916_c0_g1_i1:375-1523(-)
MATQLTWKDLESSYDDICEFQNWCWPFNVDPRVVSKLLSSGKGSELVALSDDYSHEAVSGSGPAANVEGIGTPVGRPRISEDVHILHDPRWANHEHAPTVLEKLIDTEEMFGLWEAWRQKGLGAAFDEAVTGLIRCGAAVEGALNRASSGNIFVLLREMFLADRWRTLKWTPDMLYELALDQYVVDGLHECDLISIHEEFFAVMYLTRCQKRCTSWRVNVPSQREKCIMIFAGLYKISGMPEFPKVLLEVMSIAGASVRPVYAEALRRLEALVRRLEDECERAREAIRDYEPHPDDTEEDIMMNAPGYPLENDIIMRKIQDSCIVWLKGMRAKEARHLQYRNMCMMLDSGFREHASSIAAYAVGECGCRLCRTPRWRGRRRM